METKECPKCGKKLGISLEPNVVTGERSKKRTRYWRHADETECNYREIC